MMAPDSAVYLPAVSDGYAAGVLKPLPIGRQFPRGIDLTDLIFWKRGNRLWHHREILHSIGLHPVGSAPDNAVTRMGNTDCLIVGDSGGFQIGKGSLSNYDKLYKGMTADNAIDAWSAAYPVRQWILGWLETNCHYAMTIDMPLWATKKTGVDSPFHQCSVEQLTALTVENLQFIDSHRHDRTKWLNVVQGFDDATTRYWWDAVKWLDCAGYALAGGTEGGVRHLLYKLLLMRDDGALAAGHDWIHVLGLSTPKWAILLSAVQKALRATVNPAVRISFDSASPFALAGKYERVALRPVYSRRPDDWTFKYEDAPQSVKMVGSQAPFPHSSPLGDMLTLGDLCVNGGDWQRRAYDSISNLLLMNHNVWVFLTAFEEANRLAFAQPRDRLPSQWGECLDFIAMIFACKNWQTDLADANSLLEAVSPSATSDN